MDGSAVGMASGHDKLTGRLLPGHSEWRARKDRVAKRLAELVEHYECDGAQRQLLQVAAELLDVAARSRNLERRAKAANSANRILRSIPRKPAPQPKPKTAKELGL